MKRLLIYFASAFVSVLFLSNIAQAQTQITSMNDGSGRESNANELRISNLLGRVRPSRQGAFSLIAARAGASGSSFAFTPLAPSPTVGGSGSLGRLTKWTGFTSSNSVIGNSTIFEDKFGLVGIGTDSPTSRLTVAGMIQTLSGGLKFPDGTIQTTSATGAFFSIPHDATLTGNGTTASPLGIAVALSLSGAVLGPLVTVTNTHNFGEGLRAIGGAGSDGPGGDGVNAFGGNSVGVGLGRRPGAGVRAEGGRNDTPGGFGGVGVAARGGDGSGGGDSGPGVEASGGNGTVGNAAPGVRAFGGHAGGAGVEATGGDSDNTIGGLGVFGTGGFSTDGKGGVGVRGHGGNSSHGPGGDGMTARGGDSSDETGGRGIIASGGDSNTEVGGPGIIAVGGSGPMGDGLAGRFDGDVEITGNLNVTGTTKNFKIDHPLDPENKYLYHAAIESSEALNVYSGNVTTNARGEAVVTLPDWFDAVNRDLRYQLTVIGTFAQAIVAEKARNNRFKIRTNTPNVEVSWQVTGVRSDRAMLNRPFKVEEDKPERERGSYIHPELYDQPEERGVESVRNAESTTQRRREQAESIDGKLKAHQQRH